MNYGEVLSSSWKTIWKFKVLWIFGILASLGAGGGSARGGGGSPSFQTGRSDFINPQWGNQIERWFEQNWGVFIAVAVGIVLLAVLMILVLIVLSTYGRIGLARGAWKADEGTAKLTFGRLFAESGHYFWRVILMAILIFVVTLGSMMIIGVGALGVTLLTFGVGLICLIPFFCLLGIFLWVFGIIVQLALIAIVGEDIGVLQGLQRAWDTVRDHLGESVVMGLILGIGGWIIRAIIGLPFLLAMIPMVSLLFNHDAQVIQRALIGSGVLFCLYLPVAIFLGGIVESYVGTAWTLSFRRLTGRERAAVEVV